MNLYQNEEWFCSAAQKSDILRGCSIDDDHLVVGSQTLNERWVSTTQSPFIKGLNNERLQLPTHRDAQRLFHSPSTLRPLPAAILCPPD